MDDALQSMIARSSAWADAAQRAGWLAADDFARVSAVERDTPAQLFQNARPLVVAFFGGSGVGKSSLLNRLAGAAIARVGVERPTSREMTLYLHESVQLARLPSDMPMERVRLATHKLPRRRDVAWIDAPDIDSTQEDNRALALRWLPFVDLVIYVVSPERYRDDVGWRVLSRRRAKHAWAFVMNHWDAGDAAQIEDLRGMLRSAGFEQPLLLTTCCVAGATTEDGFARLEDTIDALLADHAVVELERLGIAARLEELRAALTAAAQRLGPDAAWQTLPQRWGATWERAAAALIEGVEFTARLSANQFAARDSAAPLSALSRLMTKSSPEAPPPAPEKPSILIAPLWDDWAQSRLSEALDECEVEARRAALPVVPLRAALEAVAAGAATIVNHATDSRLRSALARPGSALQRAARRCAGFLMTALPGLALLWVAHNVVLGYYRASVGAAAFLGGDFAVNSALLVLVAWATPFVIDRALRPSLERSALRGMRDGFAEGLDELDSAMEQALLAARAEALGQRQAATALIGALDRTLRESDTPERSRALTPLIAAASSANEPRDAAAHSLAQPQE